MSVRSVVRRVSTVPSVSAVRCSDEQWVQVSVRQHVLDVLGDAAGPAMVDPRCARLCGLCLVQTRQTGRTRAPLVHSVIRPATGFSFWAWPIPKTPSGNGPGARPPFTKPYCIWG